MRRVPGKHARGLRLAVELDSTDGRMAGALYDEAGAEHTFSSWLGLLTLLEAAHVRAGRPGPDGTDEPRCASGP
jgi:hypothetical protein